MDDPKVMTTTVHVARLRLFQSTRRPVPVRRKEIETSHGVVLLTGRLGQQHADVFEALCYAHEDRGALPDGRIALLADPFKIRKLAGIRSGEQMKEIITELEEAVIEIRRPIDLACMGHLIDHVDFARLADGSRVTRTNPLGGVRGLWKVDLGKAFCKLVRDDLSVSYNPAPIARLGCGISQAVARHVKTHRDMPNGGWRQDSLIHAVAGDLSDQRLRDARRYLKSDAAGLAQVGIRLDAGRIFIGDSHRN